MSELHAATLVLVQDQYGNYVMQNLIERGNEKDRKAIIERLKDNICSLSKHKFASNVVEKCVAFGAEGEKRAILNEILITDRDGYIYRTARVCTYK